MRLLQDTAPSPSLTDELLRLSIVSSVLLAPFVVMHFIKDQFVLGGAACLIVAVFAVHGWTVLRRGKTYPNLVMLVLVPVVVGCIALVLRVEGTMGLVWCFPAAISFYFILNERQAWFASTLLLVGTLPTILILFDIELAARVVATGIMVSFFAATFLRVITQQQHRIADLTARLAVHEAKADESWTDAVSATTAPEAQPPLTAEF